ncbi:hypothetical protein NP493_1123g01015 [Ridgeia piscesae]|uniref:C-type lectin domain-containing protein n=1 Tax=Ridgeia piscesae TaxID=27915 RepID=A0AAD9NJT8_RIDPI|nr:hypothetical protein NP493_1123g01015 [Ridgeia piscesae]
MALLLCFTVLSTLAFAYARCPDGFEHNGKSCYAFVATKMNWFDADQFCTSLVPNTYFTHLVAIESPREQQWLENYINSHTELRNRDYWTSGTMIDRKRGWWWALTGDTFGYDNWAPGQPDDSGKCACLWARKLYRWDDVSCYDGYKYPICEFELIM